VRETHGKARKLLAGYDLFDEGHLKTAAQQLAPSTKDDLLEEHVAGMARLPT
jgi:hypothetical protein